MQLSIQILKKLSINFDSDYIKYISKLEFPNLEYLAVCKSLRNSQNREISKLFKNVKEIYFGYNCLIHGLTWSINLTN